jgi:hypothetical protein
MQRMRDSILKRIAEGAVQPASAEQAQQQAPAPGRGRGGDEEEDDDEDDDFLADYRRRRLEELKVRICLSRPVWGCFQDHLVQCGACPLGGMLAVRCDCG